MALFRLRSHIDYGGKSRWADTIWEELGEVTVYVEPFAGRLAVLLASEPHQREIVCDTDGYICLAPETKVLDSRLRYRPIGEIEVGDTLLGFDEFSEHVGDRRPAQKYRHWKTTVVTATRRVKKKCYRLTFTDGTSIVASSDHQWLSGTRFPGRKGWHWATTRGLVPKEGHGARANGQMSWLLKPVPGPSEIDGMGYEDGWLGGMADGEGHIHVGYGMRVVFTQRLGHVQNLLEERLAKRGFTFTPVFRENQRNGTVQTSMTGGMKESLRFLMQTRPERLIDTFIERCGRISLHGRQHYGVGLLSKEDIGEQEVIALETDSHTFIAEGLASHNCNFWRALRADPEDVAYHADYPTFHHDLTSRHLWLREWGPVHSEQLMTDPEWYDPKAAGWWAWGISNWIGGSFCHTTSDRRPYVEATQGGRGTQPQRISHANSRPHIGMGAQGVQVQRERVPDKIPQFNPNTGGRGLQVQRGNLPNQIPFLHHEGGAQGVQANRREIPHDERPYIESKGGGRGTQVQRRELEGHEIGTGERLLEWFWLLAQRLSRVVVLNRSWESAVTPTVLMHTPTGPKPPVGIFLDPPYKLEGTGRKDNLYASDMQGLSDDVAEAAYQWAVEHGADYRIAYACHTGDFPTPEGWRIRELSFGGVRKAERRKERSDCVMFSPACLGGQTEAEGSVQGTLWDESEGG